MIWGGHTARMQNFNWNTWRGKTTWRTWV